jgi:3-methyladenine DNA glycosylase/8-oxoguanine DNA glycosylase
VPAVPRPSHASAARELAARDPVIAELVARHGPMRLRRQPAVSERFEALARSITFQQLAGRAAGAIWGRTRALTDGAFDAPAVLALPVPALRRAGLSQAKTDAIRDLARLVVVGDIRLDAAGRMTDAAVIEMLTQAKGVGPWTAQMFLLFVLRRLDVWPTGDYAVRVGFGRAFSLDDTPSPKQLEVLGEPFRPYRSVVSWYCWRTVQPVPSA